jgi:hypothetical protein
MATVPDRSSGVAHDARTPKSEVYIFLLSPSKCGKILKVYIEFIP